jgi:twitching motility protein PilI
MQTPQSAGVPRPPAHALLKPTEALLRGFEFALEPEPHADAQSTADRASDAPAMRALRATEALQGTQARQGFCIGSLNLMIRYEDGSELTELPQVHRLPNAPHWFAGMANLHGVLIPVFDLARQFGIQRTAKTKTMLLVLGHGADAAGVTVDGLPQRLRFGAEQHADTATVPEILEPYVQRAALIDNRLWFDLDVRALLGALEKSLGAPQ